MEADFIPVKMLLSQLNTKDVSRVEAQLVELCNSQQGIEYLYLVLTEDQMMVKAQSLIVSLINSIIMGGSTQMSEELIEEFLIRFLMDRRIVRKHKLTISRSISYCISKHKNFHIAVLGLSKIIIINLNKAISEHNIYDSDIKQWIINQIMPLISFGHSILSMDLEESIQSDSQEEQKNKKGFLSKDQYQLLFEIPTIRFITEFLVELEQLHICIYKLQNINDFVDIFKELFELLLIPAEEGFNHKIMRVVYESISNWVYLPQLLMNIYKQQNISDDRNKYSRSTNSRRMLQSLKYQASLFHTSIAEIVLQSDIEKAISIFIDPFINHICKTSLLLYNPMVQTDSNRLCQNFIFLLEDYYNNSKQTSIGQMIQMFQTLILPLLDRILVSLRGFYFITQPIILYEKLQEIKYDELLVGNILNSLVEIAKRFVALDDGFSIYLLQLARRSFELNYTFYGSDIWECPQYITDNDAISMKAYNIFFIMAMIELSNQIIIPISQYFKSVLSIAFIEKIDEYSCGIMYFFLQNYYISIYDNNIKQSLFLFYYIFDSNINSSTELFANKFILNMSDAIVDIDFIVTYVKNISIVRDQMKWQIIQKWMQFYKDYSRKTNIRLAMCLIQSTRNKISDGGDCQQMREYISILIIIAENLIIKEGITQLVEHFINVCCVLVNRFILQSTKKVVFYLLQVMLKVLPQGQAQIFRALQLILQGNIHSYSEKSNNLYALIASSLLHFTNKDHLLTIYHYCFNFLEKIEDIPIISQGISHNRTIDHYNQTYLQVSNALFILQGYLMKHSKLDTELTISIYLKAKTFRRYLLQYIGFQYRNQLYHLLSSRCIVLEVYYCVLCQDDCIDFEELLQQSSLRKFNDYDAMIILESLLKIYTSMAKENQQKTIYIIRNILLTMMEWEKIMEVHSNRRQTLRKFFSVANKTQSFITLPKNTLQSIKKWMIFMEIKDWRQLSNKLIDVPSTLLEQIGLLYRTLCSRQIKKQRWNKERLACKDKKQMGFKRKRPNHFDADENKVERMRNPNEQIRKIRKIIIEQPQSNVTAVDISQSNSRNKWNNQELITPLYQPNTLEIAFNQINSYHSKEYSHNSQQEQVRQYSQLDRQEDDHKLDDRLALIYIQNKFEQGNNRQN